MGDTNLAEVCDSCAAALDTPSRIDSLVEMQNVSLKLAERITCDEEERQRFGYNLVTAYRFPEVNGRLDRKDAEVYCEDILTLKLSYGDAADLFRVNLGWRNQEGNQPRGFKLDLERGYWSRNQADASDKDDATTQGADVRVVPFVRDTKNALVMRLEPARSAPEMAGLQAAFKQAIQQEFQLEPRELSCEPMPSPQDRNEILFFEASEGGAGVLRQLAEVPKALPSLGGAGTRNLSLLPGNLGRPGRRPVREGVLRMPAGLRESTGPQVSGSSPDPRFIGTAFPVRLSACRRGQAPVRNAWLRCASAATPTSSSGGSTGWRSWGSGCPAMLSTESLATSRRPTSYIGRPTQSFISMAPRTTNLNKSERTMPLRDG